MRPWVLLTVVACSGDPAHVAPDAKPDANPFKQGPLWFRGLAGEVETAAGSVSFMVNASVRARPDANMEINVGGVSAGGLGAFLPHPRFAMLDPITEQPASFAWGGERVLNLMPDEVRTYGPGAWFALIPKSDYAGRELLLVVDGVGPYDPTRPASEFP